MDLEALADPDDDEVRRDAMRAQADRDALVLVSTEPVSTPPTVAVPGTAAAPPADKPPYRPTVAYGTPRAAAILLLRTPLTVDGRYVDELQFHPPCSLDVEDVAAGRITELELHARMANVPADVLRGLRWDDREVVTLIAKLAAPELRR